jgi:hypothetical protein
MKIASKNISSSTEPIDQEQVVQSKIQEEEAKSVNLRKLDSLVSQTGCSNFGRTEASSLNEDDCSSSSSGDDNLPSDNDETDEDDSINDDDDDDDSNQVHMEEFYKLISKHMKLQKRHGNLLCSHEKLIDSYALLEATHEVMLTTLKSSQPHTYTCAPHSINLSCANSCCSKTKPSCDEHVLVETCDHMVASENDELKREVEMIKMELSRLKDKGYVQPSQDNHHHMVNKFEEG